MKKSMLAHTIISIVALIWVLVQNYTYISVNFYFLPSFLADIWSTAAGRLAAIDLVAIYLSASIWMYQEACRLKMRGIYIYLLFGILIAISVTFPIFIIHRELATRKNKVLSQ